MKSNRHHENLMIAPRETDALITSHRRSHMTETAPAQAAAGDALLELALSTCSSHDPRWHADIWTATTTDAINKWTLGAHQYQAAAPRIRSIIIIILGAHAAAAFARRTTWGKSASACGIGLNAAALDP